MASTTHDAPHVVYFSCGHSQDATASWTPGLWQLCNACGYERTVTEAPIPAAVLDEISDLMADEATAVVVAEVAYAERELRRRELEQARRRLDAADMAAQDAGSALAIRGATLAAALDLHGLVITADGPVRK